MFPRELAFLIASTANRAHLRKVKNAETGLAFDPARSTMIKQRFKVGDHVTWNSEAGRVSGPSSSTTGQARFASAPRKNFTTSASVG